MLLNPHHLVRNYPDQRSRDIMEKTVAFFEKTGLTKLKADFHGAVWMSKNKVAQAKAKRLLDEGHVFAFGLSEKEHGPTSTRPT